MNGESSCVRLSLKTCPVCKTHVFDDMDTCYNCMYSFGSNPSLEKKLEASGSAPISCDATFGTALEAEANVVVAGGVAGSGVAGGGVTDGKAAVDVLEDDASLLIHSHAKQQREKHQVALKVASDKSFFGVNLVDEGGLLRCASGGYETPEDCIKEYETAFLHQESRGDMNGCPSTSDALFDEFLVEFRGFLGKFILDRKIGV